MADVGVAHQRVSFADLERWPEDGRRYELYDGEVYVVPSPIALHQILSGQLHLAFHAYTRTHGGIVLYAPLDIVLTEYDVVQPDLLFFTAERAHLIDPRKVTRHAPDLAIEILSPSTASNDRGRKMKLLARHGLREYWLVNPDPVRIEVYVLVKNELTLRQTASGDMLVRSLVLPQLSLRPNDLIPS
jgi:Uma2 family endonuclease